MKKYNDDLFIIKEKENFLLTLRKKNLNKKLLEKRKNYILNIDKEKKNSKKENHKNEKNSYFINNLKHKFSELFSDKNNHEKNYINCLNEIFEFIKQSFKDIEFNNIYEPLIESFVLEKIIFNYIEKNQNNNKNEILNLLLPIFSCIIFIYNKSPNAQNLKYIFISKRKYINLYLSLLNVDDEEIIYNIYKFLGLLSHDSVKIMEQLYNEKFLEKIADNYSYDDEKEIIEIKLWCIGQFDMNIKYEKNIDLCLKIQKFNIYVYNNFIDKNNYNDELLENFFKIIINLSYCINEEYIINILNSKIIHFLIEPHINDKMSKENIMKIIGNMSCISNNQICLELYNISFEFILNIVIDKTSNEDIIGLALWCINNLVVDCEYICLDIFFKKSILDIYRNYITTNQIINESIFYEICFSFKTLIHNINEERKKYIIKDYNIMSLIIQGFKKIEKYENINKLTKCIVELIFILLTIDDEELVNYCRFKFENEGGNEYIFERINLLLLEQNKIYNNKKFELLDENEKNVFKFILYIQKHLLDFEYD